MTLVEKINSDLIAAMKNKDEVRLNVLRMLKSELKYKAIDTGDDLSEEDAIAVLSSAAKKRNEAAEEYRKGGREDLVKQETAEYEIIKQYLPEQLSEDGLKDLVENTIAETGAISINDLGTVMKALMPKVRGRADGKTVNIVVRNILQGE
ncbi:MAG: GatB/YqeY domain-containing protein [Candidatus Zixiibacteriota bacterium]|nr:MAG: GatB/YqeY domain-containing protein [candidate division Zixibacteria bacterium]